ncbi:MAG TPA: sulfotransferase domain-containing protein, partial [Ilumatobacteraceae bacterium]
HWVEASSDDGLTRVNLESTMRHLATFWAARDRPNVVLVHYADLLVDLHGEMRRIAKRLDIDVPDDRLAELVAAARFDAMRARADQLAPDTTVGIFQSNQRFFHTGRSGQWEAVLDEAGRRRYAERVVQLGVPDLIEWVHQQLVERLLAG